MGTLNAYTLKYLTNIMEALPATRAETLEVLAIMGLIMSMALILYVLLCWLLKSSLVAIEERLNYLENVEDNEEDVEWDGVVDTLKDIQALGRTHRQPKQDIEIINIEDLKAADFKP